MSPRKPRKRPPMAIQRINKLIPRLEFAIALRQMANGNQDMEHLAQLLMSQHPKTARKTLSTLAAEIGLPYSKVIEAYQESKRLEAVVQVAQYLPSIAEGIALDAESKEVTCMACGGVGVIVTKAESGKVGEPDYTPAVTTTCIPCEGMGMVIHSGDPVARKMVLEMTGLAGANATPINAPGANILINNGGSLEDTLRAARKGVSNARQEANETASTLRREESVPTTVVEGG